MSRFEGKIGDEGDEPADAAEILAALARDREPDSDLRRGAVSRYLSASEGWQEASDVLGGAFAKCGAWLKAVKDE